jgi:hypothetical protein
MHGKMILKGAKRVRQNTHGTSDCSQAQATHRGYVKDQKVVVITGRFQGLAGVVGEVTDEHVEVKFEASLSAPGASFDLPSYKFLWCPRPGEGALSLHEQNTSAALKHVKNKDLGPWIEERQSLYADMQDLLSKRKEEARHSEEARLSLLRLSENASSAAPSPAGLASSGLVVSAAPTAGSTAQRLRNITTATDQWKLADGTAAIRMQCGFPAGPSKQEPSKQEQAVAAAAEGEVAAAEVVRMAMTPEVVPGVGSDACSGADAAVVVPGVGSDACSGADAAVVTGMVMAPEVACPTHYGDHPESPGSIERRRQWNLEHDIAKKREELGFPAEPSKQEPSEQEQAVAGAAGGGVHAAVAAGTVMTPEVVPDVVSDPRSAGPSAAGQASSGLVPRPRASASPAVGIHVTCLGRFPASADRSVPCDLCCSRLYFDGALHKFRHQHWLDVRRLSVPRECYACDLGIGMSDLGSWMDHSTLCNGTHGFNRATWDPNTDPECKCMPVGSPFRLGLCEPGAGSTSTGDRTAMVAYRCNFVTASWRLLSYDRLGRNLHFSAFDSLLPLVPLSQEAVLCRDGCYCRAHLPPTSAAWATRNSLTQSDRHENPCYADYLVGGGRNRGEGLHAMYPLRAVTFLRLMPVHDSRELVLLGGSLVWAFNTSARLGVARAATIVSLNLNPAIPSLGGAAGSVEHCAQHKWLVQFHDTRKFAWIRGPQPCSTLRLVPRLSVFGYWAVRLYYTTGMNFPDLAARILDYDRVTPPPMPGHARRVELLADAVRLPGASFQALCLVRHLGVLLCRWYEEGRQSVTGPMSSVVSNLCRIGCAYLVSTEEEARFLDDWHSVVVAVDERLNAHQPDSPWNCSLHRFLTVEEFIGQQWRLCYAQLLKYLCGPCWALADWGPGPFLKLARVLPPPHIGPLCDWMPVSAPPNSQCLQ